LKRLFEEASRGSLKRFFEEALFRGSFQRLFEEAL
jgi:hypothetical protein